MADKNQLSLVNGTPPQCSSNSTSLQSNLVCQNQTQLRYSSEMDHNLNSNQCQKPPSLVNGQILFNSGSHTCPQSSGYLVNNFTSSAEDAFLHQQPSTLTLPQQSLLCQPSKSNLTQSGVMNPQFSQSVDSTLNQTNQPASIIAQPNIVQQMSPSLVQVSSNTHLSKKNIIKPSPIMGNKPNISNSTALQPAQMSGGGNTSQPLLFQQMNKLNPSVLQCSSAIPTTNSTLPPKINKTIYGSNTSTNLSQKSSPYGKSLVTNPSFSNYTVPVSQEKIPSTQQESLVQGSHSMSQSHKFQFPNFSQSFPELGTQSSSGLSSNFNEIPQGYQPSLFTLNQNLQKPLSNSSLGEKQPMYSYSNSRHDTPTYQNLPTANKNFGPTPTSGSALPSSGILPSASGKRLSTSVPRQQTPLTNRLPPSNNFYGNIKNSGINMLVQDMDRMSVTQQGFNKLWGIDTIDLLQCRNILPPQKVTPPPIRLQQEFMDNVNCSPEIFCCTLNKIPETNSLLQKSRLPLGILIHPFRDLSQLAVIQCSSIVRCRACRTYINPFVYFVDNKRWKCNLCFRVNELPDEFQYDPVSKTYGDPSRRPEIRSSTIEFIAPSEYMLRPPQPAIYLFVLDVSRWGCDSGYLETLCSVLLEELDNIPGDSRTQIGFILFDSTIHFFSIAENFNQAHEMIVTDIEDVFLPTPDSLLVNLNENRSLIKDLLEEIPRKYSESFDTNSALGPALQAAYKLMSPTGGRITVFQSCLPNKGPGALGPREDPSHKSSRDVRHLGPQTDFYKRLSLDCSTQQISVDLFLVSSQYSDLATLGGISQFSGGCIYHFPLFKRINLEHNERLARAFRRYLTRKIGFEAVMRVRCSRGLSIHTFHGNFFVRSTDLLSLPNVNPDAGFGMQIAIEDSLFELQSVCFQAAVLYTSAKGERRIRVHTLCLPVSSNLSDILTSADQQAIIGLLGKMAVDRSLKSTLSDAREAFINVAIDILSAYKLVETSGGQNTVLAPSNLSLIPLYILALLKSTAFQTGLATRLDDRVYAMSQMKTLPLRELIQLIHPDLYHITHLSNEAEIEFEDKLVPQPARLSLSSEHLDSRGAFLLDTPEVIYILLGKNISSEFLFNIFDVKDIKQINKDLIDLPELENDENEKLRHFVNFLQTDKPWPAVIKIVTEPNALTPFLINDKAENALSYYELLHHVKAQLK